VEWETDIVVVGAGGCGLTAALTAAEYGARVVVLEKESEPGGNTAMSAGLVVAASSQLQQANREAGTSEELADDIFSKNDHASSEDVTRALCRESGPLMDWLTERGVELEHLAGYRYPGMSRAWLHAPPERHGQAMIQPLLAAVEADARIELRLATPAAGLVTDKGAVTNVLAKTPSGNPVSIVAKKVILAADGFGANRELVARYIPAMAQAMYYGAAGATGEAIEWGIKLGAAADHLSAFQPHSSIAHPEQVFVTSYLINSGAIQVNQAGRRFSDETRGYAQHALAVQAQPGRTVYEIFDERIYRLARSNYQRFYECVEAGVIHPTNTLRELATHFGLDAGNLESTVVSYNAAVARGEDEFGRRDFGEPLRPPYYGVRVTSALVQTQGGLRIDAQGRVLRPGGAPVPNLYAGGGTAAGFAGDDPAGYLAGVGLLAAFGLGRIAGRAVVL
jgi:fumarate reductase flavoprotein subunit